jgi:hypothetical protein
MVTHVLRVINDEARADYDDGHPAPVRLRQRFTMISEDEYAQVTALGSNALAVYVCLSRHANQDAQCWPSYQTIADELSLSRRVVIQWTKRLEDAGIIAINGRTKPSGDATSNVFHLRIRPSPEVGTEVVTGVVQNLHQVVQKSNQGSAESAPELDTVELDTKNKEIDISSKAKKTTTPTLTRTQLERFERWYEHYPRKEARGAAEKAWKKLDPSDEQADEMIAALSWQVPANDWTRGNRTYTPLPATYLNAGRHLDANPSAMPETGSVNPNQDLLDRLAAEVRELSQRPADPTNPNRRRF